MKDFIRRIIARMLDQYVTILFLLAIVFSVTYFLLGTQLSAQDGGTAEVQRSTRQTMLIHKIGLLGLQLERSQQAVEQAQLRRQLLDSINLFQETHEFLREGHRLIMEKGHLRYVDGELLPELKQLYFGPASLDQKIRQFIKASKSVLRLRTGEYAQHIDQVRYLYGLEAQQLEAGLEKAVSIYQRKNESMLSQTRLILDLMYALSLGSLVALGVLLLRPLIAKLQDSLAGLQQERDFSDNVVNTAQALIVGLDAEGRTVLFNRFAEENTGWSEDEIRRELFLERFIHPDQQEAMEELFDWMMTGNAPVDNELQARLLIRSQEYLTIMWHITAITDTRTGMPTMFLATGLDITEREQAEQRLQNAMFELEQLSARLQDEVNFAATVQAAILPSPKLELPGLQGEVALLTSTEVGGDYYDYYKIGAHQSVVLVGDVSGHGVAAGTMVSAAKAAVYPLIQEGISAPSEILQSLNATMLATAHQSLLMTMACLSLDARDGKLSLANAGHVLPYLRKKGEQHWDMIEASGLPLGKSLEADYTKDTAELQLDVGDRVLLFTDGLVEEESPMGEPFGYDRLEQILNEYADAEPDMLRKLLLTALQHHCGTKSFTDDVTIMVIDHSDRVTQAVSTVTEASDIIRLAESFYRHGEHPIPRISRQYVVFLADGEFADLMPRFSQDGICRVLPRQDAFYRQLGWNRLLTQHHTAPDDDVYGLLGNTVQDKRQYELTHSDDKNFIMEEVMAWLEEQNLSAPDHLQSLMILMDEMIENSLYAAPRDGQDRPYFQKGESRDLSENEEIRLDVVLAGEALGLMVTDNWGTLVPAIFLRRMSQTLDQGIEAGIGGGGLYMMWRMSDYLQVRVYPHNRTQVTLLWDLSKPVEMGLNSGFQFLFHSEHDAANQMRA